MAVRTHRAAADIGVGVGVGAFSGGFGVGGGILLVPFLVIARHVDQKRAQATSLVMVALGALAGAARYGLNGEVAWAAAGVIVIGGLVGAYLGAHVMQRSPNALLQALFGLLLITAGIRLLWPQTDGAPHTPRITDLSITISLWLVVAGVAMGLLSALFGIGGGILLIPILVTGFNFDLHLAAGTSLAVMAPIAFFGAIRLTRPGLTQWPEGLRFGLGAIFGALLGASLALFLAASILQTAFGVLLLLVGGQLAARSLKARQQSRS